MNDTKHRFAPLHRIGLCRYNANVNHKLNTQLKPKERRKEENYITKMMMMMMMIIIIIIIIMYIYND
jgi:heme/copper-type cytochrome/quinol oxidase subunit 2